MIVCGKVSEKQEQENSNLRNTRKLTDDGRLVKQEYKADYKRGRE